jgi:YD repeat-containing protein
VISLRRSRSHPLVRLKACILVPVLVLAALPTSAEPSLLGQNPPCPIQDELYRLTSDTVTIGGLNQYAKAFVYDDVGNRQTQTTSIGPAGSPIPGVLAVGTQAYTYDERDRLTSEALGANPPTTYGWDADGNLTTKSVEATYAWDRENRLVRVTKTDGTVVENTYDFDGVRVQTVTTPSGGSASTTNFLVDTSGSLSHVVAETNASGALVVHYVRGDDLLALMRPNGSGGWASRFYHADHIGSVRRLTDESGAITDGYTYSAFGELLGHTGTDPQPYAFTGEPYDPNVGSSTTGPGGWIRGPDASSEWMVGAAVSSIRSRCIATSTPPMIPSGAPTLQGGCRFERAWAYLRSLVCSRTWARVSTTRTRR